MKENDEFALKNDEYEDDARAVKESELLPIFEAMDFSGDIQPLEDFDIPEPEVTELQSMKKTDGKLNEKKDTNLKILPFGKMNKTTRTLVTVAVSLLVVGIAVLGIYRYIEGKKNASPVSMVYTSDRDTFIRLENDDRFKLENVNEVKVSADGMKIFYSVNTQSKVGKYDIKYIDANKRASLKDGGSVICSGADEGWSVNSDGSFMCYSTTVSSVKQCYLFSTNDLKAKQLPIGVEEMFLPSSGDVIYFTRKNGSIYSLHRLRYGEEAVNVASKINHVKFCDSAEGFEIIYTVESELPDTYDVYSVKNIDKPSRICSGASEIYLNDYVYGGNLYYFKESNAAVDWHDFVVDPYYENDLTLERPAEGDFMMEYGFLIKRYILDRSAYNEAVARYENKLSRDSIREELDKIDFGLAFDSEYTCNVYNHYTNKILATGISLDNILAFSKKGTPRIITRKSVIKVENKFSMDDLVEYAERRSAAQAGDYVRDNVKDSYETSDDCVYAWFDGSKVMTAAITDYTGKNTEFFMSDNLSVYALSGTKLYITEVENSEIKPRKQISEKALGCETVDGCIYYKKHTKGEEYSLNRYSSAGEQKLADSILDYIVTDENNVILFSQNSGGDITVGSFSDGKYQKIASDIVMEQFISNGKTLAYIDRDSGSKLANAGDLYVCTIGGSPVKFEGNITGIKYIKDGITIEKKSKS